MQELSALTPPFSGLFGGGGGGYTHGNGEPKLMADGSAQFDGGGGGGVLDKQDCGITPPGKDPLNPRFLLFPDPTFITTPDNI